MKSLQGSVCPKDSPAHMSSSILLWHCHMGCMGTHLVHMHTQLGGGGKLAPPMEQKWPMVARIQSPHAFFFLSPEGWSWICFEWFSTWTHGSRKRTPIKMSKSIQHPSGFAFPPVLLFYSLGSHYPIRFLLIRLCLRLCFLGTQAKTGRQNIYI